MTKFLKGLLLLLALVSTVACAEESNTAQYQEGVDYQLITPALPTDDPDRIEVKEIFWYGCPHCFKLEPVLEPWVKSLPEDVRFVRLPAIFNNPLWETHAKAYFTSEILGVTDKTHGPLFDAMHLEKRTLNDQASLAQFFEEYGVDKTLFDKTFTSFVVVKAQVNRAKDQVEHFGITGVPAVVVEGKYLVTGRMAKSYDNMLKIMDYLIDLERRSRNKPE